MYDKDLEQYMESQGWTIVCESPLEIQHEDGSFASMQAAKALIRELKTEYEEEKLANAGSGNVVLNELIAINDTMHTYIDNVKSQEEDQQYSHWETAYDLIFSENLSRKVYSLLEKLNTRLDYYDPDTSYQEDLEAFANAFDEKLTSLTNVMIPNSKHLK